ncbi:MAG: helix-turn-helix domain-containing protein [Ignavibacteria bacterium]
MAWIEWTLSILVPVSLFQILLISFYLFIKKKGNPQHRILISILLIIWGIFVSGSVILLAQSKSIFTADTGHLMNLTIFLVAPLLYIYFRSLFRPENNFNFKILFHAVPFLIIFIYIFSEVFIRNKPRYVFYPTAIYLISFLFIQNILYFIFILKDLKPAFESKKEKSKLRFFKILLISTVVLFFLKLIIFIIWNILEYTDICIFMTGIFFSVVFIIINFLVIFSLNNPDALIGSLKYQATPLSENELSIQLENIIAVLTSNKLFTDPLLSLERLSKSSKIPEKLLSQVINQSSGLNYNDFINRYRIDYAQQLIKKEISKKVLEIAYECGFNSKTTFNTAFKKFTGITPTQFRENLSSSSGSSFNPA